MSPAERGGYIDLLAHQWDDVQCLLPSDPTKLSVLSGMGEAFLNGSALVLRAQFTQTRKFPEKTFNKTLRDQWLKLREWRNKCADGGKTSGKTRRNIPKDREAILARVGGSKREGKGNSLSLSLSSSSLEKEKRKPPPVGEKNKALPHGYILKGQVQKEFEHYFWRLYPQHKNRKMEAFKLWVALSPNKVLMGKIESSILDHIQSDQWKAGFIIHPVKYLRFECWNDELPQPKMKNIYRYEQTPEGMKQIKTGEVPL